MCLPPRNLACLFLLTLSCSTLTPTHARPVYTKAKSLIPRTDTHKGLEISWSKYAIITISAGKYSQRCHSLFLSKLKLTETVAGLALLICAVLWYRELMNPDRIRTREEHERQEDYVRRAMEANQKWEAANHEKDEKLPHAEPTWDANKETAGC